MPVGPPYGTGAKRAGLEDEFLVLGADAPVRLWLLASRDPAHEFVARFDSGARRAVFSGRHAVLRPDYSGFTPCIIAEPSLYGLPDRATASLDTCSAYGTIGQCGHARQSPSRALTSASAATAAVSARMIRGPRDSAVTNGLAISMSRSPRQSRLPVRSARRAARARSRRAPATGSLMAASSSQKMSVRAASHSASAFSSGTGSLTSGTRSTPHCSAASMALARIRSRLTRSAIVRWVMHGRQPRNAHFDGLLHHIVEARALQRRKQIVDIGAVDLRPRLIADHKHGTALFYVRKRRLPFAVAAVEHEHVRAGRHAQHVDQIVGLSLGQRDARARRASGKSTNKRSDVRSRMAMLSYSCARHAVGKACRCSVVAAAGGVAGARPAH